MSSDQVRWVSEIVIVDKPLDAVFNHLSDCTTTTQWDPRTVVTVLGDGDEGVGTAYLAAPGRISSA